MCGMIFEVRPKQKTINPMKSYIKTLAIVSTLAIATSAYASVSVANIAVSGATVFPALSISGLNGSLSFSDVLASPAGATIAGGQAQGAFAANTALGEVFRWGGSANGNVFSAFSIIDLGGGGASTYQPFLFDLGTGYTFNANGSTFNPSLYTDLFSTVTVTPPAFGSGNFLEFDLTGSDAVTLTVGDTYAFGLLNTSGTPDFAFLRSSGTQPDPNGAPFQILSGGLSGTSATVPGYGGGPRNLFVGIYTTPVPEPASMTLMGLGTLAGLMFIRRRKV
jgi:hypothetical protein